MTKKNIKATVKANLNYLVKNGTCKILDIDIDEELVNVMIKDNNHQYHLVMYRVTGNTLSYMGMKSCL